jgi:thiol:disulfide interchange protein
MSVLVKASVVLFLAAEVFIVAVIGRDALSVVGAWAVVAAATAAVGLLVHGATARVVLAALLVVACVLFAVELGLFFVPAAAALLAAAVSDQQQHHHHHNHHRVLHGRH